MRCPRCKHDPITHNTGRCSVTKSWDADGVHDFGAGGCGCDFYKPNRICATCGKRFFYPDEYTRPVKDCRACADAKRADADVASFAPLAKSLRARGITVDDAPWNTGGNVMCLPVEVPMPRNAPEGAAKPYFLFSDYGEMGCGLYLDEDSSSGVTFTPAWHTEYGDRVYDKGGATPGLAARTADWFAPLYATMSKWVADHVRFSVRTEKSQYASGPYKVTSAKEDGSPLPTIPATTVERW